MENLNAVLGQDNVLRDANIREGIRNLAINNPDNAVNAGNNDLEEVVVHVNRDDDQNLQVDNLNNGLQVQGVGQQQNVMVHNAQHQQGHLFVRQQNPLDGHNVQNVNNVLQGGGEQENRVGGLFPRQHQALMQQGGNYQHDNPLAIEDGPINLQVGGQGNRPALDDQIPLAGNGNNRQQGNLFGRQRNPLLDDVNANQFGRQGNNARFNAAHRGEHQNIDNIQQNIQRNDVALPNVMGNQNYYPLRDNNMRGNHHQGFRRENVTNNNRNSPYARPNRNMQMRQNCDKMASLLWSMAKQATYVPRRRDNDENSPDL